ncbi:hypothetical protein C8R45DRAFT_996097 [Mycena sanguinolenta]|nr:hypothetical protein C8R45DRAFT_996097 [Mycena sanguinolenta]
MVAPDGAAAAAAGATGGAAATANTAAAATIPATAGAGERAAAGARAPAAARRVRGGVDVGEPQRARRPERDGDGDGIRELRFDKSPAERRAGFQRGYEQHQHCQLPAAAAATHAAHVYLCPAGWMGTPLNSCALAVGRRPRLGLEQGVAAGDGGRGGACGRDLQLDSQRAQFDFERFKFWCRLQRQQQQRQHRSQQPRTNLERERARDEPRCDRKARRARDWGVPGCA